MILRAEALMRIAWFGPSDGCFDEMLGRLRDAGVREIVELSSFDELQSIKSCDRIVLACRNRIDYPWQLIQRLQNSSEVIPWAMAVDSWWEGARRTGIGVAGHIVMPWYRWWDGWHAWFFPHTSSDRPTSSRLFSPVHSPQDLVLSDCVESTISSRKRLIVVAGYGPTAIAWMSQARLVGMEGEHFQSSEITSELARADDSTEAAYGTVVLLDESSLDTFPIGTFAERMGEQVRHFCEQVPECRVIVAASFPRWDDWLLWKNCGASELIAKPTFGIPLAKIP